MSGFNCISCRHEAREIPIKLLKWIMGKRGIHSHPKVVFSVDLQKRWSATFQQTWLNDAHVLVDDVIGSLVSGGRGLAGAGRGRAGGRRSTRRWSFTDLSVEVSEWVRFALSLTRFFTHRFRINGLIVCATAVFRLHGADFVVHLGINRVLAVWDRRRIRWALFGTWWVDG